MQQKSTATQRKLDCKEETGTHRKVGMSIPEGPLRDDVGSSSTDCRPKTCFFVPHHLPGGTDYSIFGTNTLLQMPAWVAFLSLQPNYDILL